MSNEIRVHGPPGTGKTQKLAEEIIPSLVDKYGEDKVMLTSFTKAAAQELGQRVDLKDSKITGTLHSICFQALGCPKLTEDKIKDWNARGAKYALNNDDNKDGAICHSRYQVLRNKQIDRNSWPKEITNFAIEWEAWKKEDGLMDFIDLIEEAGKQYSAPGSPSAIVIDEAQDFTKLEMTTLRGWATQAQEFWVVGDDDQCQPAGTMILTTKGEKPIETIDPVFDRLKTYSITDSMIFGGKSRQYKFDIANRSYSGQMHTFCVEDKKTKSTSNHKWNVKWNPELRLPNWNIVYLMRQGNKFRIGWCQLFRNEGKSSKKNSLHPGIRMRIEKADSIWILKVFDNRRDTSVYENYIAAEYGLPLNMFEPTYNVDSKSLYTKDSLDWIFKKLHPQEERVLRLLSDFNLDIKYPFYTKEQAYERSTGNRIMKIEAINIAKISEVGNLFMVPVRPQNGRYVEWKELSVTSEHVENETVYSLDVEKYHTYISDGICTCNCIYSFSGSDPRNMLFPEIPQNQKIILGQSYRIPRQVHTIADKIIGRVKLREPKVYLPRPVEGLITRCGDTLGNPDWVIKEALRLPGTSMILASCNYMLAKLIKQLRDEGIAFSNPWRPEEKSWNPLSQSGTALLNNFLDTGPDDSYWTTEQFLTWADFISVGPEGVIRKQGKEGLKQMRAIMEEDPFTPGLHTCREYIDCILSPGALVPALDRNVEWLKDNLTKAKATVLQYPAMVLMKHGQMALREKPKIVVGTVHSVKGAGAENVFIYPDISLASSYECQTKEGYENLCRLFYVGVTRTKENLYIMAPESRSFFSM